MESTALGTLVVVAGLYLLPGLIAMFRGHHQWGAILATTILLGWTIIGWIVAFIWAVSAKRESYSSNQTR